MSDLEFMFRQLQHKAKSGTNPKKIPRTEADCERARNEGCAAGAEFMLTIIIWTLMDKHDAPTEDLHQLQREIDDMLDSINKGYLKYNEVKRALLEEHNIECKI